MYNYLIHKINRKIIAALPFEGRVVDLGCGTAPYKEIILKKADEYIGVDWENSLHDPANIDVFANLNERLPLEDGYAHTVTSFQVMEHLPEPGHFLSECFRILKSGGRLIITVPFMWHVHEAPHDYYRFTRYGLEYLLKKSGFVDIDIRENTGFYQMAALKFNYHTHRFTPRWLRFIWYPFWFLGQAISPYFDKLIKHPEETATYTALARKP